MSILHWQKGIEVERIAVDIRGGENVGADYLAKNPCGRVPMLELDDGTCLGESVAITRYLDALGEGPSLFGDTPLSQAKVEMWQRRAELNFLLEVAGAFRNITGFFKDRETCVEAWGCLREKAPMHWLCSIYNRQNRVFGGQQFSIADITLGVALTLHDRQVVELPDAKHQTMESWLNTAEFFRRLAHKNLTNSLRPVNRRLRRRFRYSSFREDSRTSRGDKVAILSPSSLASPCYPVHESGV